VKQTRGTGTPQDWKSVVITLSGLALGALLIIFGHVSAPEAALYIAPTFAFSGAQRSKR
jgi:hypothetical protein